jgi:hypothetical protein
VFGSRPTRPASILPHAAPSHHHGDCDSHRHRAAAPLRCGSARGHWLSSGPAGQRRSLAPDRGTTAISGRGPVGGIEA